MACEAEGPDLIGGTTTRLHSGRSFAPARNPRPLRTGTPYLIYLFFVARSLAGLFFSFGILSPLYLFFTFGILSTFCLFLFFGSLSALFLCLSVCFSCLKVLSFE